MVPRMARERVGMAKNTFGWGLVVISLSALLALFSQFNNILDDRISLRLSPFIERLNTISKAIEDHEKKLRRLGR